MMRKRKLSAHGASGIFAELNAAPFHRGGIQQQQAPVQGDAYI